MAQSHYWIFIFFNIKNTEGDSLLINVATAASFLSFHTSGLINSNEGSAKPRYVTHSHSWLFNFSDRSNKDGENTVRAVARNSS